MSRSMSAATSAVHGVTTMAPSACENGMLGHLGKVLGTRVNEPLAEGQLQRRPEVRQFGEAGR